MAAVAVGGGVCGMRVLAIVLVGLLVGCAKTGPPVPPGPADRIIYPKAYPSR